MKKVNTKDLKDSDILAQVNEARKELREQRFQYAVTRSFESNPKIIRNLKRKIARLLTEQREREIKAGKK
jgi:large subunit ribosomal protein L29